MYYEIRRRRNKILCIANESIAIYINSWESGTITLLPGYGNIFHTNDKYYVAAEFNISRDKIMGGKYETNQKKLLILVTAP